MKTTIISLLFCLLVCAGCATRYDMTLSNGIVVTAKGKPRIDEKQHLIFYTDANGQTNVIPQFRVTQIQPHSMAGSDKFDATAKR